MFKTKRAAGVVAAGCTYTAEAAIYALEKGGNAVDAAIAAQLVACISEPLMTGLNAGGMAIVKFKGQVKVLDCFGDLPGKQSAGESNASMLSPPKRIVHLDYGVSETKFLVGAGSTASANMAVSLEVLHKEYGTLSMATLAEPALNLARSGVKCSDIMACGCQFLWPILKLDPVLQKTFSHNQNSEEPMKAGEIFHIPNSEISIENFISHGASYFTTGNGGKFLLQKYRDDLSQLLRSLPKYQDKELKDFRLLDEEDLIQYKPVWRDPLRTEYHGAKVFMPPPPSQSGILNEHSLEQMQAREHPKAKFPSADYLRELVNALAETHAFRNNETFLTEAMQINENGCAGQLAECAGGNTTHFSVADRYGNLVGFTSSLGETSGVLVPETGMLLNNFLGEDNIVPDSLSFRPGDRLLTMCCPTLVNINAGFKNHTFVLGSAGSDRIRTAVLQGIVGLVDGELSPEELAILSRIHLDNQTIQAELPSRVAEIRTWSEEEYKDFFNREIVLYPRQHFYFGGLHIAGVHSSKASKDFAFSAGADPRRLGSVLYA